jgi:hypothetical protein
MKRLALFAALAAAFAFWVVTVAAAVRSIRAFEATPGHAADGPAQWPPSSTIARQPETWTLVMLIHPHCSCSRASISELSAIMEKAPRNMRTYVLVYQPHEFAPEWSHTDVWTAVQRLARVRVVVDLDGKEARWFGGYTSGQTFLFDAEGQRRFSGGITLLRGHAGLNSGREDVIRAVNGGRGAGTHPVFGCAIVPQVAANKEAR